MNNIEKEYNKILTDNAWGLIYQRLGQQCQRYSFTCNEARKPQNRPLNRYRDVSPYDHSRIILERIDNGYVNANLVQLPRANRKYILTQGPLAYTVSHFWLMVWEQNCPAILMLNKVIEKSEVKCHFYWPHGIGEEHKLYLDDVQLTVEKISDKTFECHTIRIIRIYDLVSKTSRDVIQFHYMTWPDFGVPKSPIVFLELLNLVRTSGALNADVGPLVVHCSAGIGRSGTFCLVDSCLAIVEQEGPDNLDIQKILLQMRCDRMGLIQTPDQLRFSYEAIIAGNKCLDVNKILCPSMLEAEYESAEEAEEDVPPPPPPRSESLSAAPLRPLPAIPASASMGNLEVFRNESSSSEESASAFYAFEESPQKENNIILLSSEDAGSIRRRRNREFAERVEAMKKRARDSEHWNHIRSSLYKPIAITVGCLLAGALLYTYVRH